jgi:hypothetical protein
MKKLLICTSAWQISVLRGTIVNSFVLISFGVAIVRLILRKFIFWDFSTIRAQSMIFFTLYVPFGVYLNSWLCASRVLISVLVHSAAVFLTSIFTGCQPLLVKI